MLVGPDLLDDVRLAGLSHVRTSPYYPQSNWKIERWHKTLKKDALRVRPRESVEEAKSLVEDFVQHYNEVRLHSAVGYVTPKNKLEGNEDAIFERRDERLETARQQRKKQRFALRAA